ncbi:recombinase family protein [Streptomyces platensis]|uniref:recombinase family protein n=1 Tax=Streptomyces platensis TaxID=58346 RepID=UPI001F314027|nr:recombinase family protein [Streptomyces platensis]MCF3146503.1 recombinase family protein [Streptomyces platensis]
MHPDLKRALAEGKTVEDWLQGRTPCCSYARITQDRREEIGVARQHANSEEFAAKHNCAIVYRYTDNNITAADPDIERPAFLRLVRDLRARRTEEGITLCGLFVVEEERVARLPEDYLKLHRALTVDDSGVYGVSDTNTVLDVHGDSEILRGLLTSAMGEKEVRRVKRRVTRNMRDQALEGNPMGRRRFGWKGADKKLNRPTNKYLDPEESKVLREAVDLALKGKSWATIVRHFEESGLTPVRGGKWATTPVQYMLTNPALCGYRMLHGELILDRESGDPKAGNWETVCTPEEWHKLIGRCSTWFNLDGSETAYTRYRQKVKTEGKKNYRELAEATRRFLLTNILRCGYVDEEGNLCGAKMKGMGPSGTNKHDRYRCADTKCSRVSRRADLVDKAIEIVVIKVLTDQYSAVEPDDKQWYGEESLAKLRARQQEIKESYKAGIFSLAEYLEFKDANDAQISESESDRKKFYAEQSAQNFLSGFSEDKWHEDYDMRQKRKAVATVLSAVIVHPLPKGRARSAQFDPELLEPIFKAKSTE